VVGKKSMNSPLKNAVVRPIAMLRLMFEKNGVVKKKEGGPTAGERGTSWHGIDVLKRMIHIILTKKKGQSVDRAMIRTGGTAG